MIDLSTTRRSIQTEAATICYAVVGPQEKSAPAVCLIASTGRGPEDFSHLAQALSEGGVRVVLPWPRGVGGSKGAKQDIDFHDLAGDAAAALRAETGTGGAYAVGHAYGCWIARTMAQDHDDLVKGIILLAAGAGTWPASLSGDIEVAMSEDNPETERLAALQRAFFAKGNDPRPWLTGWHPALVEMQRAARERTDRESWWPSGKAPILDIVGLQDPFRPPADLEFYVNEFAPRVTLKTVDSASHALPDERPTETAALILEWLRAQRSGVVQ